MKQYHKIQTIFKRDPETKYKTLLIEEWSMPEFEYLAKNIWVMTEKIDGTNIRIMWDGAHVKIGGKTDNAQLHADLVENLIRMFPAEKMLEHFGVDPICLYGEGYGAGIQKGGGDYSQNKTFILFDAFCGGLWLSGSSLLDIRDKMEIDYVPVFHIGTLYEALEMTRGGFSTSLGKRNRIAEGLVCRPMHELMTRRGERIITKIKHKDFNPEGK